MSTWTTPAGGGDEPPSTDHGHVPDTCEAAAAVVERGDGGLEVEVERSDGHNPPQLYGDHGDHSRSRKMIDGSYSPPSRMRGGGGRRNRPRRRRHRRDGRGVVGEEAGAERGGTGTCCRSNRAAHRLLSVVEDAAFVGRVVDHFRRSIDEDDPASSSSSSSSNNCDGRHRRGGLHRPWPVVCNERCGSWYGHPFTSADNRNGLTNGPVPTAGVRSCYFKSTDGHAGTWNFSLKRLNLPLLEMVCHHGGCLIVDATKDRDKTMPDSFSRTIPIWCAVMNRAALRLRIQWAATMVGEAEGDDLQGEDGVRWRELHTPRCSVPLSEHEHIEGLIEGMVDELLSSGAIKDQSRLVDTLGSSPLRPYWITRSSGDDAEGEGDIIEAVRLAAMGAGDAYTPLVCVSCSEQCGAVWRGTSGGDEDDNHEDDCGGFWYTQGGADDHEAWSRGLTPKLFWRNVSAILGADYAAAAEGAIFASATAPAIGTRGVPDEGSVEDAIDEVVRRARSIDEECWMYVDDDDDYGLDLRDGVDRHSNDCIVPPGTAASQRSPGPAAPPSPKPLPYDTLGASGISVGSRRAGRPPECWDHFDAILNVTTVEYEDHIKKEKTDGCYYLQIPVREGKGDRTELERWMAVALVFVVVHACAGGRILIHCAQGRDRSVAVAICALVLFCDLSGGEGGGEPFEGGGGDCSSPSSSSLEFRPWCRDLYPSLLAKVTVDDHHGGGREEVVLGGGDRRNGPETDEPHRDGKEISTKNRHRGDEDGSPLFGNSGMDAVLVESLLGREGRDLLLGEVRRLAAGAGGGGSVGDDTAVSTGASTEDESMAAPAAATVDLTLSEHKASSYPAPPSVLATKESVRSALHAVQQIRPRACPSRHTMKKVHRFLLSGEYEA